MNSPIVSSGTMESVYSLAIGLLAESRKAEARLSEEEREFRKEKRRLASEERYRQSSIVQSVCPSCKGKLVRGKKNKKNDYKRDWKCSKCNEIHSI